MSAEADIARLTEREKQRARYAAGLCPSCGASREGRSRCPRHLAAANARQRRRTWKSQ